jgi:hypothetical protein
MVGMSKEQILSCMGSPANTAYAGGTEVWTYDSGNGRTDSYGDVSVWGNAYHANGIGWTTTTSRFCKVDVIMNGGRVTRLNYRGPTGGLLTKGEQCAFAVDNCVQQTAAIAPALQLPMAVAPRDSESTVAAPSVLEAPPSKPPCTAQDRQLAQMAKRNGYEYVSNCE